MNYRPVDPDLLIDRLADYLAAIEATVRVAIDGAAGIDPDGLAGSLIEPLRERSRPAVHVRADSFWRDASLRLEYGRTDEHSLRHDWLDVAALRRELLDPLGPHGNGRYLTSLRDPATNRSTREPTRHAEPGTILLLSGQFLLGQSLPFDRVIRLSASAATLTRVTPPDLLWTLPAVTAYEDSVKPSEVADIDIRLNDPRHPAIRIRALGSTDPTV
ncbi:MAG TPA: uridine kinase [Micromonosporaceae bacterium]|jgi:hypothetical protein